MTIKVEKILSKSTSETIDGVNNQGTTGAQAVTNEVKTKGYIVIPFIILVDDTFVIHKEVN